MQYFSAADLGPMFSEQYILFGLKGLLFIGILMKRTN